MPPSTVARLEAAGLLMRATEDGRLVVTPATSLTDDLRQFIRTNKENILAELATANHAYGNCPECLHLKRPGGVSDYCSIRNDLPAAYGTGHPLRLCPPDGGLSCTEYVRGFSCR